MDSGCEIKIRIHNFRQHDDFIYCTQNKLQRMKCKQTYNYIYASKYKNHIRYINCEKTCRQYQSNILCVHKADSTLCFFAHISYGIFFFFFAISIY